MAPERRNPEKRPRGARNEARTYRRLAAWARCHGCKPSRHVIHKWVKRRLVPPVQRHYLAWGAPVLSQSVHTGAIVLAVCHYRYREGIGRLNRVAAQIWLDGHSVPAHLFLAGFQEEIARLNREGKRYSEAPNGYEDLADDVAYAFARGPVGISALAGVGLSDRQAIIRDFSDRLSSGAPVSDYVAKQLSDVVSSATGQRVRISTPATGSAIRPMGREQVADVLREGANFAKYLSLWALVEPNLGLQKIRSPSTRANRRAIAFVSLVHLINNLPTESRMELLELVNQLTNSRLPHLFPEIVWS